MQKKKQKELLDYLYIILGTGILAFSVNMFFVEQEIVTGGVSGLGIVIEYVTRTTFGYGIPLWLTNLVVNIPLFVISGKQRGFKFIKKSLLSTIHLTFALYYTSLIPNPFIGESDLLLSSIFGGALIGVGLGLVLRASATTGGTDMLASIIKFKAKEFPIAKLMLIIDTCIIVCGMFVFGINKGMYAIISVYTISKVVDGILEGMRFGKAALVISDKSDEIAKELMSKVPRGVTGIKSVGMYTKKEKNMLYIVVSKNEIVKVTEIVKSVDDRAFITITDVREVLGEGFTEDMNQLS